MLITLNLQTPKGESLNDITGQIEGAIRDSGVQEGLCVLFCPHTTAALTMNSGIDPKTAQDILDEVHRLVPTRVDFRHIYDTPADAAGHIKSVLVGNSLSLIVAQGKLLLGHSQSVFFYEFDGPRSRKVVARIIADLV
jgi:secondary thiamine-phosphate synthase enzyme